MGFEIVWSAIVGGIAGALTCIVHIISRRGSADSTKPASKNLGIATIVLFFLLTVVLQQTGVKQAVEEMVFRPTKLQKTLRTSASDMANDPDFQRAVSGMTHEQAKAWGQLMSAKGLKRLSLDDLMAWNELRIKMATNSPALAVGLWKGGLDPAVLQQAIESLPDTDLKRWIDVSMRAMKLELKNAPYTAIDQDDIRQFFQIVQSKLKEDEADRLVSSASKGVNIPDDEARWVMMTLMSQTKTQTDQAIKEHMLRVLATLASPK